MPHHASGGPRRERAEAAFVTIVLKYGGNAMAAPGEADPLLDDVAARVAAGDRVVVVHGGGPQIDAALALRGLAPLRVRGLRVTDGATLDVTEMVLCGATNKALVRALARRGARAAGISGQDGRTLVARDAPPIDGIALGFVGEIERVDASLVIALLSAGFVPVVAPLGISASSEHAYNINADTAAGAIAGALRADAYVVVTNVARVRRVVSDPASGIARLTVAEAAALLEDGTFDGGMRPKMQSALDALARGARSAIICGGGAGALERGLRGEGTTVTAA